jgi:hypothetical protein
VRSLPKDDFGREYLLAVGEQYGVRGFDLHKGKLTAACDKELVWNQGVNVAHCYVDRYQTGWRPFTVRPAWFGFGWEFGAWNLEKKPPKHFDVPREECTCGFYAYSDPKKHVLGHIKGVVRLSGRTLIGTKGWRFERGEIVALRKPTHEHTPPNSFLRKWQQQQLDALRLNYPKIPLFNTDEEMFKAFPLTELESNG